jgi:hypothetical protein
MKEWTFLLQKYGDRSWLPLDSPDMEILEGRYRIVVQTDHPNTDINVRVCHLATAEEPPKRRIQKRTNRTNTNGLMVVAPYTQLQPGNWELCCFLSDPLSDLVGDMLHHAVRLRVVPYVEEECQGWDDPAPTVVTAGATETAPSAVEIDRDGPADTPEVMPSVQEMAALNVEIAQALGVSMDRLVEMTDHLSHQLIEDIFKEFNLNPTIAAAAIVAAEEIGSEPTPEPVTDGSQVVAPIPDIHQLQIVLAQDGWMATRGETLAIAGRLEYSPETERETALPAVRNPNSQQLEPELEGAIPQELQLQLRDPQTSKVLFHACQSCPTDTLPTPFNFLCNLPDELSTHLLLGEVLIAGVLPGAESVLVTLKTFNFTVTVDPQGLVAEFQKVQTALAGQSEQAELAEVVAQFSERLQKEKERQTLDLSFLNMAAPVPDAIGQAESNAIATHNPTQQAPARKQILPPLLHKPDPEQAGKRKLELPVFAGVGANAVGQGTKVAIEMPFQASSEAIFDDGEVDMQSMVLPDLPNFSDRSDQTPAGNAIALDANRSDASQAPASPSAVQPEVAASGATISDGQADLARIDELSSPIRSAFQALNLQDKFLTRLSSMAADPELTTLLKLTLPQTEPQETVESEPVAVGVGKAAVAEVVTEPESTEVVVDDDPSWQEWVKRAGSRPKTSETRPDVNTINPLVLPADHPVPLPTVELGIDEIVAGKPINIRVKLPSVLPKIYVKLWVNDRQTRTLLDGPRWLVDFLPNGFDELEASTQITAPFDSMNIRLEAIAVEMQTQRESQKVSLDCEVIPADLPDELFDFEGF